MGREALEEAVRASGGAAVLRSALKQCAAALPSPLFKPQEFLQGHTDRVTALALSRDGRLLASGQVTHLGCPADIIVWDLARRAPLHRLQLQKVKIQALSFSCDGSMLASLGGPDDNSLVLWDVAAGAPICGAPGEGDFALRAAFYNGDPTRLVTAGNYKLRVWQYDA